ncbi:MAG: transcriptional repressor LexA [Bacilli bacterium]|nr:transcriptional repressor LexA [Bacilli bacterium]
MEKLTDRQNQILDTIKRFIAKNGYPPTVREIGAELNLSSPATTHFHLNRLESKGYIKKDKSKNRTLELLVPNEYLDTEDEVATIALIGTITAGNLIEAIENPDEFFSIPSSLIPKRSEVFALNVKGESMINKGIHDGDIVIIEKAKNANNGEIVAAMTDEYEVTLKTFYKEKDHIRLQPENDTMAPIILNNVSILGKAVGLYRKF